MPRRARQIVGGLVYHVLNRGCGRMRLFSRPSDYAAFEKVMIEALARQPVRLLSYCLMPNHWHLVLWPTGERDISNLMFWLTMTHTQRWRHARQLVGLGPLYQGRFKAFPVEEDDHLLTLCRYVERNALRAGLVEDAERWRWSSLHARLYPGQSPLAASLAGWPVDRPDDWLSWVNEPQSEAELAAIQQRIRSGRPLGSAPWEQRTCRRLGLSPCPRPRGRPPPGNK